MVRESCWIKDQRSKINFRTRRASRAIFVVWPGTRRPAISRCAYSCWDTAAIWRMWVGLFLWVIVETNPKKTWRMWVFFLWILRNYYFFAAAVATWYRLIRSWDILYSDCWNITQKISKLRSWIMGMFKVIVLFYIFSCSDRILELECLRGHQTGWKEAVDEEQASIRWAEAALPSYYDYGEI